MSAIDYKKEAPKVVRCKIIIPSDTYTEETNESGRLIHQLLEEDGHGASGYEIMKGERHSIYKAVILGDEFQSEIAAQFC
ncbi:hypothetical protein WD019_06410 [Fictibacillus sp. Mic-4]|uniref:hypothetical protein n=1 Tax=Fictibacillus sp. Mic-4 TaxID=3132826 RepID=UPI003CEEADF0